MMRADDEKEAVCVCLCECARRMTDFFSVLCYLFRTTAGMQLHHQIEE